MQQPGLVHCAEVEGNAQVVVEHWWGVDRPTNDADKLQQLAKRAWKQFAVVAPEGDPPEVDDVLIFPEHPPESEQRRSQMEEFWVL